MYARGWLFKAVSVLEDNVYIPVISTPAVANFIPGETKKRHDH